MKMKLLKKTLALLLVFCLTFACLSTPAQAVTDYSESGYSASEKIGHGFYKLLDKLIDILGKVLNTFIPGLNWTNRFDRLRDHAEETALMGEKTFDTAVRQLYEPHPLLHRVDR